VAAITTASPHDDAVAFAELERRALSERDAGHDFEASSTAALELAEASGDPGLLSRGLGLRAEALHAAGDTLAALEHAERAVTTARSLAAAAAASVCAQALIRAAIMYDAISSFTDATRALVEAVGLLDEASEPALLASAYNSLGVVRSRAGDPEAGLTYYRRARLLRERIDDQTGLIQLLNNSGINLKNLGRFQESLALNDEALALCDARGDAAARTTVLANRGILLAAMGDAHAALACFAEVEAQATALGASGLRVEVARRRAELFFAQGDDTRAAAELDQALTGARATANRSAEQACLALRSQVAERRGDLRQALDDLRAATDLERNLRDAADAERLRRLTLGHEVALLRQERADERERRHALERAYTELERLHEQLAEQANELAIRSRTDALTGVANRAHLDERLADETRRLERYGGSLAVAMVDVDHFKLINDRFGHAVGDEALRQVAALLKSLTRESDLVARYGGEEFALVLPESDRDSAVRVCEKVLESVRSHPWHELHPRLEALSVSAGVATSDDASDPQALLRRADARLIAAKRSGRARVVSRGR